MKLCIGATSGQIVGDSGGRRPPSGEGRAHCCRGGSRQDGVDIAALDVKVPYGSLPSVAGERTVAMVTSPMDRRHILDEARSGRCGERDRAAVLGLAIIRAVALGFLAFLVLVSLL